MIHEMTGVVICDLMGIEICPSVVGYCEIDVSMFRHSCGRSRPAIVHKNFQADLEASNKYSAVDDL
jgi:hypothetical protein